MSLIPIGFLQTQRHSPAAFAASANALRNPRWCTVSEKSVAKISRENQPHKSRKSAADRHTYTGPSCFIYIERWLLQPGVHCNGSFCLLISERCF